MAASFMYSFFTAFGVILIGAGLALQVLYIEQEINKEDNSYLPMQIASILINTLVVVYLLISITFYRPYQSNFGLFGSISDIREREYKVAEGTLNMRPVLIQSEDNQWRTWSNITHVINEFNDNEKWKNKRNGK